MQLLEHGLDRARSFQTLPRVHVLAAEQKIGEDLRQHGDALAAPHGHGRATHLGQIPTIGPLRLDRGASLADAHDRALLAPELQQLGRLYRLDGIACADIGRRDQSMSCEEAPDDGARAASSPLEAPGKAARY